MKTSLGIWAFGATGTGFVPGGSRSHGVVQSYRRLLEPSAENLDALAEHELLCAALGA